MAWKYFSQYRLLMWKNFVLLRRSPFRIVVEILWPLALFCILAAVRSRDTLLRRQTECHFYNKPMPSAGLLPFLQGVMCTSNNTCYQTERTDELSGRLTSLDTSLVSVFVDDIASLLSNDSQRALVLEAVQQGSALVKAYAQLMYIDAPLRNFLDINESSLVTLLASKGVALSNTTVENLFESASLNSTAILEELVRIQQHHPRFIPLLETALVDFLGLSSRLAGDSQLLGQAIVEDFRVSIIETLPNITELLNPTADRMRSILNPSSLLERIRGLSSIYDLPSVVSAIVDGLDISDLLNLTTSQQQMLQGYCQLDANNITSTCLLFKLVNSTATKRSEILSDLCTQPRYGSLVTCLLEQLVQADSFSTAEMLAMRLCTDKLLGNTSLCSFNAVVGELLSILNSTDPYEILCSSKTSILEFKSAGAELEVRSEICNLTRHDLEIVITTMLESVNLTAFSALYIPQGFTIEKIFRIGELVLAVTRLPSVQSLIDDIRNISTMGFMVAVCGEELDVPFVLPLYDSADTNVTSSPDLSMMNDTSQTSATPQENQDDGIFSYWNSSEWQKQQYCRTLFEPLTYTQYGSFVFRQLEPILFGKIPYGPATGAVNDTIRAANQTFQTLGSVHDTVRFILTGYQYWESQLTQLLGEIQDLGTLLNYSLDASNRSDMAGLVTGVQFFQTLLNISAGQLPDSNIPNVQDVLTSISQLASSVEDPGSFLVQLKQIGLFAADLYEYLDCIVLDKFEPFATERELEEYSLDLIKQNRFWAAVVFNESVIQTGDSLPSHVTYKIRMNTDKVDDTDRIVDKYWRPGSRSRPPYDTKYITFGFAYLQDMIEKAIIGHHTEVVDKVGIYLQEFPYPCYTKDNFINGISRSMPLFMVLSWLFSVALLVKSIVYEKQERLKEQMKIMGMTNGVHWAAWYTTSFVLVAPSIVLLCILFKFGKVLMFADSFVLALFLYAFSFSTACLAFLFSVFFTRANLAACCGAIFYFALYLPYAMLIQYEELMTTWQKMISCLLSPVSFGYGTMYIARFEEQGVGINWSNIHSSPTPADDFNLATCIGMLFLDGVLYWLLAWYKENVFPGTYGVPKPFYFLFTWSFWWGPGKSGPQGHIGSHSGTYQINDTSSRGVDLSDEQQPNCEPEPTQLRLGVKLNALTKIYNTGNKLAVDRLSLNLYEDQITSFLGHNGAGKSTTMSILCGLFPPTKGTATVYGHDILTESDLVRQSMGFCPQYNVLFHNLTVAEHVLFYGQLKGLTYQEAEKEMETMLGSVGMLPKRDELTKNLSGGMKRKLSVMCAFVGDSRCVILDEPTAGVDPFSRRQIWELLLRFKHGRTILLSTHHMDEADFLGDRIAIISHGRLCCAGSSLYLKNLHGNGYYLTLVKEGTALNEDAIDKFVCERVPGALLVEGAGQELTFQLPTAGIGEGSFVRLFNDLDLHMTEMGISSYGLADTSLEEVFLKVAEETGVDSEDVLTDKGTLAKPAGGRSSLRLSNAGYTIQNLKNKLKKFRMRQKYQPYIDDDVDLLSLSTSSQTTAQGMRTSLRGQGSFASLSDSGYEPSHSDVKSDMVDARTDASSQNDDPMLAEHAEIDGVAVITGQLAFFSTNDEQAASPGDPENTISHVPAKTEYQRLSGWRLTLHQMRALFIKRWNHVRRDKIAFLCEIILPAAFILLAMAFALAVPPVSPKPPLELQPWMYTPIKGDPHLNFFFSNDDLGVAFTSQYESLLESGLYGTRCMNPDVYQIPGYPCDPTTSSDWSALYSDVIPQCDCEKTGYQQCEAAPHVPSNKTLMTTDYLLNLTSTDISAWLLNTMTPYIKRLYGGFSLDVAGKRVNINETSILAILNTFLLNQTDPSQAQELASTMEAIVNSVNVQENIKVWYNNKGWAAGVSYMNAANNLILRAKLQGKGFRNYTSYGITAINYPMNRTDYQLQQAVQDRGWLAVLISLCVIFAMSMIPATFVLYLISDRASTSKSLQFVSGMNRVMYWLTNFIWDMFNYSICSALCFLIFVAFQEQAYVSAVNGPCLALLMLLYGWAMIPLMYPFSFLFKEPSMAYVVLACLNIFIGMVSTLSTFILELFPNEPELNVIGTLLKKIFLIFPHYCLGRGLIDISVAHLQKEIYQLLGKDKSYDPFSWDITGKNLLGLFCQGLIFLTLIILIECEFFVRLKPKTREDNSTEPIDQDVLDEEQRVLNGSNATDVLSIKNLCKVYRTHSGKRNVAVQKLTFGVPAGQCFGLLGVNGAGKTSTFRMLTGIMRATSGDAIIANSSVMKDPTSVRQHIGYCPQFDAIDPLLTGREHLEYYARLRGIPSAQVKLVANDMLRKLGLFKYQDKLAGSYSGGNKRKLQAAISLIGDPEVIFMDEPTTGMDPKARRFLWDCILRVTREGHAVVLTSHSMEECEVLCHRLAIMVNGTFKCLGTAQHLKNKYGEGYHVTIRITGINPDVAPLLRAMEREFDGHAILLESNNSMVQYHIKAGVKVAHVFSRLESIKVPCCIEDYSVTQTSLDHVFIRFARKQKDAGEETEARLNDEEMDTSSVAGSVISSSSSQRNLII